MIRIAALLLLSLLFLACSGDSNDANPDASPSVTPFPTPRPGSTAAARLTPEPSGGPEAPRAVLELSGVFDEPQPLGEVKQVALPESPASPFAAWDGVSVLIYDTETGKTHDFGPGSIGSPAFSHNYLVYTVDNRDVDVVDLKTMESRFVTRGILAYFLGDDYIVVNPGDNNFFVVNLRNGMRSDLDDLRDPLLKSRASLRWGGAFQGDWLSERFAIRQLENPQKVCEETGSEQRACLAQASSHWVVEDIWGLDVKLVFDANRVAPAGGVDLVIATTPVCEEAGELTSCYEVLAKLEAQNPGETDQLSVAGTTNIFLVNVLTGEATFVATASYNASTGQWPMNWPLVANEGYVAWTESYCGDPAAMTRIYNRSTGEIAELDISDWLVLEDGGLGIGERGASAVIDPATYEYVAVLPELASVSWSSDLRYAAVGQGIVRGGVCQ